MYNKAINKLITSINKIYKKSNKDEITLGMARKNGLSLAFKQFQKDLNGISQKEASSLSKDMQKHYLDKYMDTTGATRRPLKKAKEKVKYPWSGMNYQQRINKNSAQLYQQTTVGLEKLLRKGVNKSHLMVALLDLADKYNNRHSTLIRTELWHMDLLGELDGMKVNKVKYVQYVTAGDRRVCPECQSLEEYNDGIYLIEEAPTLPRHPRCRCHLIPYEQ